MLAASSVECDLGLGLSVSNSEDCRLPLEAKNGEDFNHDLFAANAEDTKARYAADQLAEEFAALIQELFGV